MTTQTIRDLINEVAFLERRLDEVSSALVEMPAGILYAPRHYTIAREALCDAELALRGALKGACEELERERGEFESPLSEGGR